MDQEATPTLPPVPGVDLEDYKHTLIERLANPQIRDTIARLCAESSGLGDAGIAGNTEVGAAQEERGASPRLSCRQFWPNSASCSLRSWWA
jgi:Mannitol dehydrogenase C-terminal domain